MPSIVAARRTVADSFSGQVEAVHRGEGIIDSELFIGEEAIDFIVDSRVWVIVRSPLGQKLEFQPGHYAAQIEPCQDQDVRPPRKSQITTLFNLLQHRRETAH